MDVIGILLAIFQKIDANLQQMEARFDEIQQTMRGSQSQPLMQIPDDIATEKELQAPVEGVQDDSENLVKMADVVITQDPELEPLANRRDQDRGVLEAPPSVLGTEPAKRAREFARTGPIPSPIPTVSVIPNLPSPNLTHGTLEFIDFLQEPLKVNSDPLEVEVSDVATDKMGAIDVSVESIEVCLSDFRVDSLDLLANQSAQQVFVIMPIRGSNIIVPDLGQGNRVIDPGIARMKLSVKFLPISVSGSTEISVSSIQHEEMFVVSSSRNFDPGGVVDQGTEWIKILVKLNKHIPGELLAPDIHNFDELLIVFRGFFELINSSSSLNFDPGGYLVYMDGFAQRVDICWRKISRLKVEYALEELKLLVSFAVILIDCYWVLAGLMILVFDPGIVSKGDDRSAQLNIGCILEQFQIYYQQELRGFHFGGHIIRSENAYLLRVVEVVHHRLQWDPGGVD